MSEYERRSYQAKIDHLITTMESQNSQIESLKAITELAKNELSGKAEQLKLAVKGLKDIRDGGKWYGNTLKDIADETLSEIERLSHA